MNPGHKDSGESKNDVAMGDEESGEPSEKVAKLEVPDCCICWEAVESDRAVLRPCGHEFHKKCIDEWFKTSRICSYCRTVCLEVKHNFSVVHENSEPVAADTQQVLPLVGRNVRYLMTIVTPGVYMYTLVAETPFTLLNTSSRTVEIVSGTSQLLYSVAPSAHQQFTASDLDYHMRFADEPAIEFSMFNLDRFFTGVLQLRANEQGQLVTRLRQVFAALEADNSGYMSDQEDELQMEVETPRMRRRRERSERVSRTPARRSERRGRRGGRGGGGSGMPI